MSDIAIKVEGLSKRYKLGSSKKSSLRESLSSIFSARKGQDDNGCFWALKNVDFSVKPGEALGVIGHNGAGKSTLLKILSRITEPTSGCITIEGRVSSLLEVGTGFHPELTGRENIYLNGTILGMRRREVKSKFDEIVSFSGVEKFIDTPVKHYSSGMYVRLAFAVAAHLEPEILIVDEVLAVGDAEFQKKCLSKMSEVAGSGRTVVFVSHNMGSIKNLCDKALLLNHGSVVGIDDVQKIVRLYNEKSLGAGSLAYTDLEQKPHPFIASARIESIGDDIEGGFFKSSRTLRITCQLQKTNVQKNLVVTLLIRNNEGDVVIHSTDELLGENLNRTDRLMILPSHLFKEGTYYVTLAIGTRFGELYQKLEDIMIFSVSYNGKLSHKNLNWKGILSPDVVVWE